MVLDSSSSPSPQVLHDCQRYRSNIREIGDLWVGVGRKHGGRRPPQTELPESSHSVGMRGPQHSGLSHSTSLQWALFSFVLSAEVRGMLFGGALEGDECYKRSCRPCFIKPGTGSSKHLTRGPFQLQNSQPVSPRELGNVAIPKSGCLSGHESMYEGCRLLASQTGFGILGLELCVFSKLLRKFSSTMTSQSPGPCILDPLPHP